VIAARIATCTWQCGGVFRSDLFYRLNVFPIEIPPLRERADDIPLLIDYFVKRFARGWEED